MKVFVYYTDLIWDNYQGGSGKIINSKMLIELSGFIEVLQINAIIFAKLLEKRETLFEQNDKPIITKMEII